MSLFDLTGKVAIVTGGSQGLGKGFALALAQAGADVAVVARLPEQVEGGAERLHSPVAPVVEEIKALGRDAVGITADVRDPEQVADMASQVLDRFGRIDVLVNNAGGSWGETFRKGPLLEITLHDLEETFRLNIRSVFLCSRAVAPVMMEQKRGSIINIASIAGQGGSPGAGAYGAAKAAIINLTRTMALEWVPNIRVNAVAPSTVEMPHRSVGGGSAEQSRLVELTPMGRAGTIEEHAGAVVYLASDAASYVTGTVLSVNGGRNGA